MVHLSDKQLEIIRENARAFWADLRVGILRDIKDGGVEWANGGHVFLYVDTWNGAQYFTDLGWYADPEPVHQAVLNCDAYKNRSKVSGSGIVREAIVALPKP